MALPIQAAVLATTASIPVAGAGAGTGAGWMIGRDAGWGAGAGAGWKLMFESIDVMADEAAETTVAAVVVTDRAVSTTGSTMSNSDGRFDATGDTAMDDDGVGAGWIVAGTTETGENIAGRLTASGTIGSALSAGAIEDTRPARRLAI
jgi:hypothetical protein